MGNLKDYATGIVASAPSPDISGTTLTLQTGHGARFPATPFFVTAHATNQVPDVNVAEKLLVTDVTSDTLTFTREQGDTTAQPIAIGWRISNAIFTADIPTDFDDLADGSTNKGYTDTEKTKLAGIEAAADVTDAANVASAGAVMKTVVTTKGDLIVGTGSQTVDRLPIGTDGQILVADSAETTGVKWEANASNNYSYLHDQSSPSTTWSVAHSLDDENPTVSVVIAGEIVEPESITIDDADNLTITFGSSVAGKAKVLASGGVPTGSGGSAGEPLYEPKLYVYLADYKAQTEIDAMIASEISSNGKFWGVYWENFRFEADGDYIFVDESVSGVGNMGFTSDNKTRALAIADNVIVGVAGNLANGAGAMMSNPTKRTAFISALVTHVTSNGFNGVSINFEPIPLLTGSVLTSFRTFISALRTALDTAGNGYLLSWAGHLTWDSDKPNKEYSAVNYTGETNMAGTNQLGFTLNDLDDMQFDIIEQQAYDQFYDFGVREFGVTSYDQVADSIDFANRRIPLAKVAVILGVYGVRMNDGDDIYGSGITLNNGTRAEVTAADATFYSTAARQSGRGYLIKSVSGSKQMIAADQTTVDNYYKICKNKKVQYIGFWLAGDYYYPSVR